jgi:transposase InsO family protein
MRENPPIPFVAKLKRLEADGSDAEKVESVRFEFLVDPSNPNTRFTKEFFIFKDGTPEEYIKWLMGYRDLELLMPLKEALERTKMLRTLLKGRALSLFEYHLSKRCGTEEEGVSDHEVLELVIRDLGLDYISRRAIRVQKYYMRRCLFMGPNTTVQQFIERLNELNRYLLFFPEENPSPLNQDEVIEILDQAKPPNWHEAMISANIDIFEMDYESAISYFIRLENLDKIRRANGPVPALGVDNNTAVTSSVGNSNARKRQKTSKWCHYCDKNNHNTAECREIAKAKQHKKAQYGTKAVSGKKSVSFLLEEINALKKQLKPAKAENPKKRKGESLLSTEINLTNSSDEMEEYFLFPPSISNPSIKQVEKSHPTTELVVTLKVKHEEYVLRALADTGASSSIILEAYISKDVIKHKNGNKTTWNTMGGQFTTDKTGVVTFLLPEFNLKKQITWEFHVDGRSKPSETYGMIIGRDLLGKLGIILNFSDQTVTWDTDTIPMKDRGSLNTQKAITEIYLTANEPQSLLNEFSRSTKILDAEYKPADLEEVIKTCENLGEEEQHQLLQVLQKYEHLFDGTLGEFNMAPISLTLADLKAKPVHARPYTVPRSVEQQLRKEIARLVDIGVLEEDYTSEWASPTFAIAKKNGTIRVVSDFRKLNSLLQRHPFPIPKIGDMIRTMEGFTFATALDLNMGYYHIKLDADAQKLCTIIFPWGKYKYKRLPMGIKIAPDVFQNVMSKLTQDLEYVKTYLDDLLILTNNNFADHLTKLEMVLARLSTAGMRVNASKSKFFTEQIEYLGYWITRKGIQPVHNKVEAILKIKAPNSRKELRRFIGIVNYYRDMWFRRSELLAPLTSLTSNNVKFEWLPSHQEAFDKIKKVIETEVLLAYPDFNKPFHIYTDASDHQLGAVIMQDKKPIAFYSRKLNAAQRRYTTTERELLSTIETCKEYKNILLGYPIIVFTDHKNNTFNGLKASDRVLRWLLLLEEYGVSFEYLPGKKNVVADALSRLDIDELKIHQEEVLALLSESEFSNIKFPMHTALIFKEQMKVQGLREKGLSQPHYSMKHIEGYDLLCFKDKIYIPQSLRQRVLSWYHEYLLHPGQTRTEQTIRNTMTWPGLTQDVERFCSACPVCQLTKKERKKYGLLPPKTAESDPWVMVCVDLVGPFTIKTPLKTHSLLALTMIDPATGWFEIVQANSKTATSIQDLFHNTWLARYPRPQFIVFDNGGEFKREFKQMCENYGIKAKPTTSHNPQANAIIERVHKVVNNMLRSFDLEKEQLEEENPFEYFLQSTAWAIRSTYHTTLQATPCQLVFGRDMIHNIAFKANWDRIQKRKQDIINKSNNKENKSRIPYQYKVGDQVLLETPGILRKLSTPRTGPYPITQVYNNGTVQIQKGIVSERVNIRRISPFNKPSGYV